jgi:hypothetical protein
VVLVGSIFADSVREDGVLGTIPAAAAAAPDGNAENDVRDNGEARDSDALMPENRKQCECSISTFYSSSSSLTNPWQFRFMQVAVYGKDYYSFLHLATMSIFLMQRLVRYRWLRNLMQHCVSTLICMHFNCVFRE